ncbi:hypothetical protein I317_01940 [Kwoniella heveanensis CBS 569]|nr:hypothetical protein I317_01940 [Kwoniella heveanensis CBS 569]
MPTPLSPSSSQEIIPISPPSGSIISRFSMKAKAKGNAKTGSSNGGGGESTSSKASGAERRRAAMSTSVASQSKADRTFESQIQEHEPSSSLRPSSSSKSIKADPSLDPITITSKPSVSPDGPTPAQKKADPFRYRTFDTPTAKAEKRKASDEQRVELNKKTRAQVTQRMLYTRGKEVNPVTNSDLYTRTDHFVSCSTGHQQSNRSGAGEGSWTYWKVRSAQMNNQAREQQTSIFSGCTIYINGSTGPKVSNLQVQHLISSNGGRLAPTQSSSCTHIIANGGLSGTKTQKWIDGQGSRGASRRAKVIKVEWVLDSVEKGVKLSEAGYGMVEDPSQPNLFKTLGIKPKLELQK